MNIYLLTQTENSGYDTYDSCVVAAENEDQARMIRPDNDQWHNDYRIGNWAYTPGKVKVELIGIAITGTEPVVICTSFNAG